MRSARIRLMSAAIGGAVLSVAMLADATELAPHLLLEPRNLRVSADGAEVICPSGGAWEFAVLPVTYTTDESGVTPRAHSCTVKGRDPYCQAGAALQVEVRMAGSEAGVAAALADPAESGSVCANLDPTDPACEAYPAPVARIPVAHLPLLSLDPVPVSLGARRRSADSILSETTAYHPAARDVAYHPLLGAGLAHVASRVHLAGAGTEVCR